MSMIQQIYVWRERDGHSAGCFLIREAEGWVSPDKRDNSVRDCHNTQQATSVPTEQGLCVLSMIHRYMFGGREMVTVRVSSLQRQRVRSLYVVTVLGVELLCLSGRDLTTVERSLLQFCSTD